MGDSENVLGRSGEGREIELRRLTQGPVPLLMLAGVHGDEWEGVYLIERFVREKLWAPLEGKAALWVIPRMNPDGFERKTRGNSRGVDLNRNMPTKDWSPEAKTPRYQPGPAPSSEPETRLLIEAIERVKPRLIVSAHSWKPMINYNGPCRLVAHHMAAFNKYVVSDDIGYPTPGSLGTWAGWERKLPTITLEIEEGSQEETIWTTHAQALFEALRFAAEEKELG